MDAVKASEMSPKEALAELHRLGLVVVVYKDSFRILSGIHGPHGKDYEISYRDSFSVEERSQYSADLLVQVYRAASWVLDSEMLRTHIEDHNHHGYDVELAGIGENDHVGLSPIDRRESGPYQYVATTIEASKEEGIL